MGIVSISLNDDNLEALEKIQKTYGLNGRSEAVRASLNAALSDIRDEEEFEGIVEGVLVIVRRNHDDPWMIRLQAKHEASIKTQMHSHLKDHKCLEVMIVSCEASELRVMLNDIRAEGKADYMKFVRG